ncbi:hypothetical protein [Phytohabitans rumicis]|uniref:Lipoprotein n=1 Tax=Phytohabitans rumicis TaxID=1076125 RepID=A0A6V8LT67_9ACTN|nr:hypothetical protein [Phytohabitans rumicis]GFJ95945.1 hypothetical protein Prum_095870 [Phytohabitans rumicis]
MRTTTVIVTVLTGAVGLLAGCAGEGPVRQPPPAAEGTASTTAAVPPASVAPVDPQRPRGGPADATVGTRYPFDLYVHCGGEFTRFAGKVWQTDTPPGNLAPRPDAEGRTRVTGYLPGTMELVRTDQARFVIDLHYVAAASPVVAFHPATTAPPLCK